MGHDETVLFADDTNIFAKASTKHLVYEKANAILTVIYKYMVANKLHINTAKCCHIYFTPKRAKKIRV